MNQEPTPERHLKAALDEMEPPQVSADFTAQVLGRLDQRDRRRRRRSTIRWVLVAQAAALVLAIGFFRGRAPEGTQAAPEGTQAALEGTQAALEGTQAALEGTQAAQVEELLERQQALQQELSQLEAERGGSSLLYLEGGDGYDLVLDLGPFLAQETSYPAVPALRDLRVQPPGATRTASRRRP